MTHAAAGRFLTGRCEISHKTAGDFPYRGVVVPLYIRPMAMRHDEAFKFLFDLPEVWADMLRLAAPGLWPLLDPESLRNLRVGDAVAADLSLRRGDALARVDFLDAALPDGRAAYLVVPAEFQSDNDTDMTGRVREYTARQLDTLRRQQTIPPNDRPPVLAVVLYDGAGPWSADRVASPPPPTSSATSDDSARWLVTDGQEALRPLPPEAAAWLVPFQPQAYLVLDLVRAPVDDWPAGNRLRAVARLLRQKGPEALLAALTEELARFAGAPHRSFREALHAWAGELWTRWSGRATCRRSASWRDWRRGT